MKYIYVAGPYSQGNINENVRRAIMTASVLVEAGHEPYVPHLNHLWDLILPNSYQYWLKRDQAWLRKCDALIRIPGPSDGADGEVDLALRLGIPVFYSATDCIMAYLK